MISHEMLIQALHVIKLYNDEQLIKHGSMHILSCPFCHSEAKIKTTTFGDSMQEYYTIECKNGHSLDSWKDDKQSAIAYWNNRQ